MRKRRTNVLLPQSSVRSLKITPWALGMRPVISVARLGMHTGLLTQALSKTRLVAARRSRFGVSSVVLPMKPL